MYVSTALGSEGLLLWHSPGLDLVPVTDEPGPGRGCADLMMFRSLHLAEPPPARFLQHSLALRNGASCLEDHEGHEGHE